MLGAGRPAAENSPYSDSILTPDTEFIDMGSVSMGDGLVRRKFFLENPGEEDVRVERVYTSCMCTTAWLYDVSGELRGRYGMQGHGGSSRAGLTVPAGEKVAVEAVFDPAAHGPAGVGLAQRDIFLETNSRTHPKVVLRFEAAVRP